MKDNWANIKTSTESTCQNDSRSDCNPEQIADKVIYRIHQSKRQRRYILNLLSVAAIISITIIFTFTLSFPFDIGKNQITNSYRDTQIFSVPTGATATLYLPDGSKLIINSGSEVIYPKTFNESQRKIYIEGEAYLSIAKDSTRPFIVETNDFSITVHGTKFNINTNGTEYDKGVVLVEGSVNISDNNSNSTMLTPGQMASVTDCGIYVRNVQTELYTCWINGYINMNGKTIKEVARKLSDYYGIPIICELSSNQIYGKLELKNDINDVLDNIKLICPVDIHKTDKGYIFFKK